MSVAADGRVKASGGRIAAAALLPPLGVFRDRGPGRDFWIACALTVLGFLPGAFFALHTVLLRPERASSAARA